MWAREVGIMVYIAGPGRLSSSFLERQENTITFWWLTFMLPQTMEFNLFYSFSNSINADWKIQ